MYSQNKEELHILDYFKDFTGTLLSIGENDGKTFSNSLALIERSWKAVLVEPSEVAFEKLTNLHSNRSGVISIKMAIGTTAGKQIFHESGAHLKDGGDISLLSSLKESETERWKNSGVKFTETEVDVITYEDLIEYLPEDYRKFDFITIDCEGLDLEILSQINLSSTKLLCIEWNLNEEVKKNIMEYCKGYGIDKIIYESSENLLICKKQ